MNISAAPSPNRAGPHGWPVLGALPRFRRDPLAFLAAAQRDFGDAVPFRLGPERCVLLSAPSGVQRVLVDNARNYTKHSPSFKMLRVSLGQGLLTSEGDFWLRQRRLAQPAFHRQQLAALADTMTGAAAEQAARWHGVAALGEASDVNADMMRVTLDIVARALFGAEVGEHANTIRDALDVMLEHTIYRVRHPFSLPERFPTPRNRRFRGALELFNRLVYRIIAARRQGGGDAGDLLSLLMLVRDEDTGERMSDLQLRDEVLTLLLAGHETTANALSWCWHLLAQHPEQERQLHAELDRVLAGRPPTLADLPALPYTRTVIDETLRLFPPAYFLERRAAAADRIDGAAVDAGTLILMSPYVTHRHPALWPEPERFRPERFAPGTAPGRPRFAYYPFGGGARQCIGNAFALMEAQLILASLAQQFSVAAVPEHPVKPEPSITLRPKHGLLMRPRLR